MKQTALKRKTPLKSHKPLKAYKGLNKVSDKQRLINAKWKAITDQKAKNLNYICQWCHLPGRRDDAFNPLDGHHIIKRRYNIHTYMNCLLCHRLCHQALELHNIGIIGDDSPYGLKIPVDMNKAVK